MIRKFFAFVIAAACLQGAALADDTDDIHAAVLNVYELISGPVGEARDWDAFREAFLPMATFTVSLKAQDGTPRALQLTVDDYIERSGPMLMEMGFSEEETQVKILQLGEIATVMSAYHGIRSDTGETVVAGVNTFIVVKVEDAWKVASISWREADEEWPVDVMFK